MLPESRAPIVNGQANILVVDDDEIARDLLSSALSFAGYSVDVSADAIEGLQMALAKEYDIVLTDVRMPVIDGIVFCNLLHKKKPHATIVMISGFTDFDTVRKALKEGVYDFIPKPVQISDVEVTIARALERAKLKRIERNYQEELERRVTQQADKIKKTHLNAVLALASALNAKDTYTRNHGQRVADVSKIIASTMNLGDDIVQALELAGLLHDIGKIGIPDRILNKSGPLTPSELEAIRKHPIVSYDIVSQMIDDPRVLDAILYHHERMDGTGYPRGLVATEIPLPAAILSVADVYDALTSRRSYRDAYSPDMAKEFLKRHNGTRLHGEVIEAFTESFSGVDDNMFFMGVAS